MRERLIRFMTGRNGADNLSRAVSVVVIVLLVVSLFFHGDAARALWILAVLGMVYVYFRMFSRNVYKRRDENAKYLRATAGVRTYFRGLRERWSQRRDYKFFRCPSAARCCACPRGRARSRSSAASAATPSSKRPETICSDISSPTRTS